MPKNANEHLIDFKFDVSTDSHGDPVEVTVNANLFFDIQDPETLERTVALLKSHPVRSFGDFVDLTAKLAEQSRLDQNAGALRAKPPGKKVPTSLADARRPRSSRS